MFEVIKPGLETSVQDYPGRIGFLNQGFPPSGPMDSWSFRLANLLVGNHENTGALECQYTGPTLKFEKDHEAVFFLSPCEALISKNGSILLSSNQIKEKNLKELPSNFIVFATTSQLVESISEGLRIIKNQSTKYIPSNITTIQDFETEKEKDFMSYGSSTKNLYLLLLEDL